MQLVAAFALTVVLRAGLDAGPSPTSAEAELEALLATTMRKSPPAEVLVVLEGPDPKLYRLEEATVRLDGTPVVLSSAQDAGAPRAIASVSDAGPDMPDAPVVSAAGDAGLPLAAADTIDGGTSPLGTEVSDGDHVVSARLVYRGRPTGPYPWQQGPRWVLPARVALLASHGLRLTVRLAVEVNAEAPAAQRLALHSQVDPEMLVAVDDAPLPPPPLPQLPAPAVQTSMAASVPLSAAAPPASAAPRAKKKAKKTVARAKRTSAGVSPSAAASKGVVPAAGETAGALEEATARLRSALAAPVDGGVLPAPAPPR